MTDSTDQIQLPFKRHLEWLLLEGRSKSEIERFYSNIQLPIPKEDDFDAAEDRIEGLIFPPITKRNLTRNMYTAQDRAIMKKYGYEEIYLRRMDQDTWKPQWEMVGKMLNHPVMRLAVDCCLVSGFEQDKLVELLPIQFNIAIDLGALELYTKYFFDHANMDKGGWRYYLRLLQEDVYSYERLFAALTKPKDEVLYMVGLPTSAQFGNFLKNVLATANYKFRYYARHNSPEADKAAEKWAKIGFKAGELDDKFSKGDMTDFAKFVQTDFEYIESDFKTIEPEMLGSVKPSISQPTLEKKTLAPPPPPTIPDGQMDPDNI